MKDVVSGSMAVPNSIAWLFATFAAMALLLGAVGIYGLISYRVAERRHEIGVRVALGAKRRDVLRLIVGQGLVLALAGVAAGGAAALGLTRLLGRLLYGVKPVDPATFAIVPLLLLVVALLAAYVPARRAARVDPVESIRSE